MWLGPSHSWECSGPGDAAKWARTWRSARGTSQGRARCRRCPAASEALLEPPHSLGMNWAGRSTGGPRGDALTHSLAHSLPCSLIHYSLAHSFTHSFTRSLTHSFTCSLTHSLSCSLTPLLTHSFTCSHTHSHSFVPQLMGCIAHRARQGGRVLCRQLPSQASYVNKHATGTQYPLWNKQVNLEITLISLSPFSLLTSTTIVGGENC